MRIRRERDSQGSTLAVLAGGRWIPLRAALAAVRDDSAAVLGCAPDDLVGVLAGGAPVRARIEALCARVSELAFPEGELLLPLRPALLRCFSEWSTHWEQAARALARRYHPAGALARAGIASYEALTQSTFPALRPGGEFRAHPIYYLGNHLNVLCDGDEVPWPGYCRDLDYELEFGAIVVRPLLDATPEQALEAVGGFVVVNDFSSRDMQWREHSDGQFGPVVKTKGFATAISAEVVTPDEVLPGLSSLSASVLVNGEVWARTSTAGMQHGLAAMVAWASHGEQVHPGELIGSGTLPNGCGLEIDRWLRPGDSITLEIERIGRLTSHIGKRR